MKENWKIFKNQFATQVVPLLILMLNVPLDISVHKLWCLHSCYSIVHTILSFLYLTYKLFFAMLPVVHKILWFTVSSIEFL